MGHRRASWVGALCIAVALIGGPALAAGNESQRLSRAKDLITDEQWLAAIQELKAAANDPRETGKDEALFWLAHCQSQARDTAAAVGTIQQLERGYPRSLWIKPARSLRLEIAQRMRRNDVLWYAAAPPPPPPAPAPGAPPAPGPPPPPPAPAFAAPRAQPTPATPPAAPLPPSAWMPAGVLTPDLDLRIQALGSLMQTDALKVIPMLKEIALTDGNPTEARRALFLLAQSNRADARATVLEVAKTGPEPVRLAAVRELGRLGGPAASNQLLQVYATANPRIKFQIVTSLGQRDDAGALMRIAQSESDRALQKVAITMLGEAGGRAQLTALYARLGADSPDTRRAIIAGLFNAQADEELIRIAEQERDPQIQKEVFSQLRLLGTPKALAFLARQK
jgi:hypothetical protein